ncbi:aldehyde dehydrogenase family protein [Planctomycetota bacterium]
MNTVTEKITSNTTPKIPAFRFGHAYDSLTQVEITTTNGQETVAQVGLVNPGLIRRDLLHIRDYFKRLQEVSIERMLEICAQAAELFLKAELPVCAGVTQTPEDYIRCLSASCGLPYALIRANMAKIVEVLANMPEILKGLTRGLDLLAVQDGVAEQHGVPVSFYPTTTHLGVVLPSNSPGVNSLWLPAVALRIPVLLKPGREDPWTPWRIINALRGAGCPDEAFGFYPADHDGAGVILSECQRVIMFGDAQTVARYAGDLRVSVHGPGYSKVLIGEDQIENYRDFIDVLADSVARNGGRSCVNASTIVVPRHGQAVAEALAKKLTKIVPLPLDAEEAQLAGFANGRVPQAINQKLDQALAQPGATDVTASQRCNDRLVELEGQTYLQPTAVYCGDSDHELAKTEFMYPFASVVEIPQEQMLDWIGPSLVVTAITEDPAFRQQLLHCPHIQRLNLGAIPTGQVRWDQPHEGNLFEFLFARRAFQEAKL